MGLATPRVISDAFAPTAGSIRQIMLNQMFCKQCKSLIRSEPGDQHMASCSCRNVTIFGGNEHLGGFVQDTKHAEECSVFVYIRA